MERKIHLSEISLLIVESTAVSLTSALLNELIKNNIKVIFCDEKHLPSSQLVGFYDNYHSSKNILLQCNWEKDIKALVWTNIIKQKIWNQAKLLENNNLENKLSLAYIDEIQLNDTTNREGHASKVYFNLLFDELSRRIPSFYNSALNYGYAILLSIFCREIVANGYITQLGIWHSNQYNNFNLASDLMEPYRVIVDDMALRLNEDCDFKPRMSNILNVKVDINNKITYLDNAIHIYVLSVLNALNNKTLEIVHFKGYELPIYENFINV